MTHKQILTKAIEAEELNLRYYNSEIRRISRMINSSFFDEIQSRPDWKKVYNSEDYSYDLTAVTRDMIVVGLSEKIEDSTKRMQVLREELIHEYEI